MIRKINIWTIEKEYIDPTYHKFIFDNFYEDTRSGSIRGYGYGSGLGILLSKRHKCEVSVIQNENFSGIGAEKLNSSDIYAKYID